MDVQSARGGSASCGERISVVVPCHNYGRFLGEALESVFGQTRPVDEIVVVDDGSTDETPAVLAHIQAVHPEIRVISRRPARGAVSTFNDGVRATAGELVVILSADDRMSPEYLSRLEQALHGSGADFAYAPTHLFGATAMIWPSSPFDSRRLARGNFINGSTMFRRAAFERVGGFDPGFETLGLEDWAFWLAMVAAGAVGVRADGCWLDYRQHPNGARNPVSVRDIARAHRVLRRRHPALVLRRDVVRQALRIVVLRLRDRLAGGRYRGTGGALGAPPVGADRQGGDGSRRDDADRERDLDIETR